MTRASILLTALLILNTLLGVLCLVVAHGERRSRALRLWGWGLLLYAFGILVTIPPELPLHLRKVVGNALIAYAPILTVEGALAYTTFRLRRRWTTIAFVLSIAPIVINHLRSAPSVLVDILAPAPIANVLFLIAAVALVRIPPPDARNAARFVAGLFVFCIVVWSARMLAITTSIGATNDRDRADLTIALFSIAQIVITVATTLGLLWIEVRNMAAELRRQADTDALTGLRNRRATMERFEEETWRAMRRDRPFALLLLDVDHFKQINDQHGHLAGDAALRHLAAILTATIRNVDAAGRVGGEEFVVLLSEEDVGGARTAAERIREAVATAALPIPLTVSCGVAVYGTDGTTWDRLFAAADARLYEAKQGGRNRVIGPMSPIGPIGQIGPIATARG